MDHVINRACYFYEYQNTHRCLIKNESIPYCDSPCKFFEVVSASPIFLNRMDMLYRNAKQIPPENGYTDIVMHSTALYFVNKNADGEEYNISPEEFAQIIKMMYKDNPIPNIRLIACYSGCLEDGVAQILSDILRVTVKAPIGPVVVDFFGNMYVEDKVNNKELYDDLGWRIFTPRKGNIDGE